MIRFAQIFGTVALLAVLAACAEPVPPSANEPLVGVQSLLSPAQKTATATVHAATVTARAQASSTALAVARATATADWLPAGRRTINKNYTKWDVIGTLVARYTATPTPSPTPTP